MLEQSTGKFAVITHFNNGQPSDSDIDQETLQAVSVHDGCDKD